MIKIISHSNLKTEVLIYNLFCTTLTRLTGTRISSPFISTTAVRLLNVSNLNTPHWEKVSCNFLFLVCGFISWSGTMAIVAPASIVLFAIFFYVHFLADISLHNIFQVICSQIPGAPAFVKYGFPQQQPGQ